MFEYKTWTIFYILTWSFIKTFSLGMIGWSYLRSFLIVTASYIILLLSISFILHMKQHCKRKSEPLSFYQYVTVDQPNNRTMIWNGILYIIYNVTAFFCIYTQYWQVCTTDGCTIFYPISLLPIVVDLTCATIILFIYIKQASKRVLESLIDEEGEYPTDHNF